MCFLLLSLHIERIMIIPDAHYAVNKSGVAFGNNRPLWPLWLVKGTIFRHNILTYVNVCH
jgi:hypothetical protein